MREGVNINERKVFSVLETDGVPEKRPNTGSGFPRANVRIARRKLHAEKEAPGFVASREKHTESVGVDRSRRFPIKVHAFAAFIVKIETMGIHFLFPFYGFLSAISTSLMPVIRSRTISFAIFSQEVDRKVSESPWLQTWGIEDPEVKAACDALEPEFELFEPRTGRGADGHKTPGNRTHQGRRGEQGPLPIRGHT